MFPTLFGGVGWASKGRIYKIHAEAMWASLKLASRRHVASDVALGITILRGVNFSLVGKGSVLCGISILC